MTQRLTTKEKQDKMASGSDGGKVGAGEMEAALDALLEELCKEHGKDSSKTAIETMLRMANNIIQEPNNEKFRNVRTENKTFSTKVWQLPEAQQFMLVWGWTQVEDHLVLASDDIIKPVKHVLQRRLNLLTMQQQRSAASSNRAPVSEKDRVLQEERKRRLEQAKHEKEEKKRIMAQIKADRENLKARQLKDSKARHLQSGGGMKKFEDIGVDLDGGGGG
ncbi:predicted protein [Nematostella vectensis]|uniref:PUB domain-containing protein n=2 Tax=Nematostella vectensis TaxID=45351 RepID=A7S3K8_NEMVE|nr:predicted protein [Nematostella vectensis]|eukprot:XP_001633803.1 predicted protein [Nematostella vectensis]